MSGRVDVVIVGAGNAALCAALSAREHAERVCVLETAAPRERGGNSHFTAGLVRFGYDGPEDVRALVPELPEAVDLGHYDALAFRGDLERLSGGRCDATLARVLAAEALPSLRWLRDRGGRFCLSLARGRQAFERDGRLRFWGGAVAEFDGGGREHVRRLFEIAERSGIEIRYESRAHGLVTDEAGRVRGVHIERAGARETLDAGAVVLACGGFEASRELRAKHLGPAWADVKVRGSRHNTGDGIRMALDIGADPSGDWSGCHAVAWDAGAPDYGNLEVTNGYNKHSYPFGITVNRDAERFIDEGADFRNYTYAAYGAAILEQPGGEAFQIFDARGIELLRDEYHHPDMTRVVGDSIGALAEGLGLAPERLERTVRAFNAAVGDEAFDPTCLDGRGTRNLEPPKSNWATAIALAPFLGTRACCGITFTFGGLHVDAAARVLRSGGPLPGLFAAGELVGGLYYGNYPGGSGLTAGCVFGRLAGRAAAEAARS